MAINIQSLFSDIIETPAQRQERMLTEGILRGRELTGGLTGLARTQAPLVSALSMQMPQRQEALRRTAGGMLGLDVRTESEKLQDILRQADTSTPVGMRGLARDIRQIAPAKAMTLLQTADEQEREQKEAERRQQEFALRSTAALQEIQTREQARIAAENDANAQQNYRNYVAGLVEGNEKFSGLAPGIRNGSVPKERMEKIVDELMEKPDPKQLSIFQGYVDDNHVTLQGNFFTMDGEPITLEPDDKVATASVTGAFGDVTGLTEQQKNNLSQQEIAAANFVRGTNNVLDLLRDQEDINTFVASIAGTADDLIQEGAAVFREIAPDVSTSIESYKGVFDGLGVEGSRFQSAIFGLALQYAAASGLGSGRDLGEKDVENAIRAIGSDRSDPAAITAVLNDKKKEIIDRYRGAYFYATGEEYQGNLDPFATRASDQYFTEQ